MIKTDKVSSINTVGIIVLVFKELWFLSITVFIFSLIYTN